jgi:uroporphyrinogen-III synthase
LAAAQAMGLDAHASPLFAVRPIEWRAPDPADFDALLIGSANAVRHAGPGLGSLSVLPVLAVGEATATAARQAGLSVAATGGGDMQALVDRLDPGHRRLLRLTGATRVDLDPPAGVTMAERVVYASEPLALAEETARLLAQPAVIMLHSAQAAAHFASEIDRLGCARAGIALAAISQRAADAAGGGWARVGVADRPDDSALLAMAAQLCQTPHQWTRP